MMASELAKELHRIVELNGDYEVKVYNYGCAGHCNCGEPYRGVDEVLLHTQVDGARAIRMETD